MPNNFFISLCEELQEVFPDLIFPSEPSGRDNYGYVRFHELIICAIALQGLTAHDRSFHSTSVPCLWLVRNDEDPESDYFFTHCGNPEIRLPLADPTKFNKENICKIIREWTAKVVG